MTEGKAQSWEGASREEKGPASVKQTDFQVEPCKSLPCLPSVAHGKKSTGAALRWRAGEQPAPRLGNSCTTATSPGSSSYPKNAICHIPKMGCVILLRVLPWSAGAWATAAAVLHLWDSNTRHRVKPYEHNCSSLTKKRART